MLRDASGMTIRPALRPGAILLRRDATHLQIGTSPGIVLRDQPGLFPVLRLLDGIRDVSRLVDLADRHLPEFHGDLAAIVRELMAAGVVFDARTWDFAGAPGLAREARWASLTGTPTTPLGRRSGFRIRLVADRPTREIARTVGQILARAGVDPRPSGDPDLLVMLSNGEPSRQRFHAAMESGVDHLRVVLEEDRVRIGPLVRPGFTPCINCHDLHRGDWDNAWPALMTQFGATAATPPALCATTLHIAAATVAAEILADCDEAPGETAGQCLIIGPGFDERRSWPVSFHPDCACTLLAAA